MTKLQKKVIKQALLDVDKMECDFIDTYPQPSKTVENISRCETSKIVEEYNENFRKRSMPLKRKIMIGVVTVLLVVSMMFSVSAIRKPIIEFFVEIFDEFVHIFADDEIKESLDSYYVPTYLPSGYTEENEDVQKSFLYHVWSNDTEKIVMTQRLGNLANYYLDNEDAEYTTEDISVYTVHYTLKNEVYTCVWANDEYTFMLKCPESLGWDTVVDIITSVQEVKE